MPWADQRSIADTRASCMASSARSNDPDKRISVAMMRPDSRRKIVSTAFFRSSMQLLDGVHLLPLPEAGDFKDGPHFHAPDAATGAGELRRPLQRLIQVAAVQNDVAAQLL